MILVWELLSFLIKEYFCSRPYLRIEHIAKGTESLLIDICKHLVSGCGTFEVSGTVWVSVDGSDFSLKHPFISSGSMCFVSIEYPVSGPQIVLVQRFRGSNNALKLQEARTALNIAVDC